MKSNSCLSERLNEWLCCLEWSETFENVLSKNVLITRSSGWAFVTYDSTTMDRRCFSISENNRSGKVSRQLHSTIQDGVTGKRTGDSELIMFSQSQ